MTNPTDLTAAQAAQRLGSGELTSEALVQACIGRIAEREGELQAWEYFDADYALEQARTLDRRRSEGGPTSPLHGIPVGIKDIIDTADMPTESGTPHFKGHRPERDAAVVARLREQGAVILGKTVTTELAALWPSKSRNPVDPAHTPGGSSAGSGAAVGAGMVPLALGTQTGGSVIRPASFCGVYGMKPTLGFVSRRGVTLQSHTLDTVGFYGRSIEDLALIGDGVDQHDPGDDVSYPRAPTRLQAALGEALGNCRLAFWKTPNWSVAEERAQAAIQNFAAGLGAACTAIETAPLLDRVSIDHKLIQAGENAHYYGPLYDKDKSLLSSGLTERLEAAFKVSARDYLGAVERRDKHYAAISEILDQYDAILCLASAGPAPRGFETTGDPIFNGLWTYLGVPCVSLPLITIDGMPMGVQLVGKRREEAKLLQIARWVENKAAT